MQNKEKKKKKAKNKEWRGQEEERKGQEKSDHPPDHKPGWFLLIPSLLLISPAVPIFHM